MRTKQTARAREISYQAKLRYSSGTWQNAQDGAQTIS